MNVLIIDSTGLCVNCICADSVALAQQHNPGMTCVELLPGMGGPGWTYTGGVWAPPTATPVVNWKITVTAMRNRFQSSEQLAIYNAKAANPAVQIYLDDLMACINSGVDLQDQNLSAYITAMVTGGLLTQARATQILTTPPTSGELQ